MLKRQRASTPPHQSESSPSAASSSYTGYNPSVMDASDEFHVMKRRRTVAPSLDGQSRGVPRYEDEEDGYEEEDSELIDEELLQHDSVESQLGESRYKGVNSLLHQLHFEHQRRIAMVSYPHVPPSSSSTRSNGAQEDQNHSNKVNSDNLRSSSPFKSTRLLEQRTPDADDMDATSEMDEVRCRYEKMNRLLGSIVQERMGNAPHYRSPFRGGLYLNSSGPRPETEHGAP